MLAYLSGPMTGLPNFNYPAFHRAAERLRELGVAVVNPAETAGGATHLPRETFMSIDIGYVAAAQCVIVMEGWARSRGAQLEVLVADALGKPVYVYDPVVGIGGKVEVKGVALNISISTVGPEADGNPEAEPEPEPEEEHGGQLYLFPGPHEIQ